MNENEAKRTIQKYESASKSKKRKCFLPDCHDICISSHLLQKNGILNRIAYKNHLYQFGTFPFNQLMFAFQKVGINEALTFPGFCNAHDTSIFKDIETKDLDFSDYKTNLLFSYRILANELRKKEIIIDYFSSILNDVNLRLHVDNSYLYDLKQSISGDKQSLKDGEYFLERFYLDINTNTKHFSFFSFELPFVEFCASGVFSYETTEEVNIIPNHLWDKPLTDIYFNLLPLENKSIVIFGCLTEMKDKCWNYILSFKGLDERASLKNISDLLLTRIENWMCSHNVYLKLKSQESEINKIIQESIDSLNERSILQYNIFDYLNK